VTTLSLTKAALTYLRALCLDIPNRRVGSDGNRAAVAFFADTAASVCFQIDAASFDCIDWETEGVDLHAGGISFEAFASPYSLGCQVDAPLAAVSTVAALASADLAGRVVLLHGEIATHQLMPRHFPFYNPEEHQQIIQLLEAKAPLAIIAATTRDLEMVGSMYPFPLFEDGDFDIPSVYMTAEDGERLLEFVGQNVSLHSRAQRIPSTGHNIVAEKGRNPHHRVVLFAHIDTKADTPGAIDNAAGVVALLLLAELLADYDGELGVELVAMNGEDYYAVPGQMLYLTQNADRFDEIVLGINIDGAGYYKGGIAYSLYDCPQDIADLIHETIPVHEDIIPGEPWYQGDHGLFLYHGRPALAFTSEYLDELMADVVHTSDDTMEIVDAVKLAHLAEAIYDLISSFDHTSN
jgi:aminopeptidase YwaD